MSASPDMRIDQSVGLSEANQLVYNEIKKSPRVAAILSLVFVGLGQFYLRQLAGGVVFIVAFFIVVGITKGIVNPLFLICMVVVYASSIRMAVVEARRRNGIAYALLKEGDKDRALLVARTGRLTRESALLTVGKVILLVVMWMLIWDAYIAHNTPASKAVFGTPEPQQTR